MGLWSYGGFKLTGSGYPQIFSAPPPSGETARQTRKSFRGARTCSRSSITVLSLLGLRFHPLPGGPKTLSFLSVCLSVTLLNVRVCVPDFAMKALEYIKILIPLDRGRFVVVHPCSTFSDCCQLVTPLNAEIENMAKIGIFRRQTAT